VRSLAPPLARQGEMVEVVGVAQEVARLQDVLEPLARYWRAPNDAPAIAALRKACEEARAQRWAPPPGEVDILKAMYEGIGGCADRWLLQLAEYEREAATVRCTLEAVAWDWNRGGRDKRSALMHASMDSLGKRAGLLQDASDELAQCLAREASRALVRWRFCGSGVHTRFARVQRAAAALQFAR
jgi:hypothetical protein